MTTLRISHVTNKNFSFSNKYYVVEEKKLFLKLFSYWKECKFLFGCSHTEEERRYIPYTFYSLKEAKDFIKDKYANFSLSETLHYRVIPDGFDER